MCFPEGICLLESSEVAMDSAIIINEYDNFLQCFHIFSVKLGLTNCINSLHCEKFDQKNLFYIEGIKMHIIFCDITRFSRDKGTTVLFVVMRFLLYQASLHGELTV